ncbi:hypothetical protein [Rhizobium laguerreae]|uniref:hypothetical protein n=1 Tax=Rhizobium laguerreae TaxID=1076926 RepID=UPI0010529ED3|nr:hypothetical protein [Rhizobium laguerreae]
MFYHSAVPAIAMHDSILDLLEIKSLSGKIAPEHAAGPTEGRACNSRARYKYPRINHIFPLSLMLPSAVISFQNPLSDVAKSTSLALPVILEAGSGGVLAQHIGGKMLWKTIFMTL